MLNGTPIVQNSLSPYYVVSQNGSYSVQVSDAWGCSASSQMLSLTDLGIAGIHAGMPIVVYPNPTTSVIIVKGLQVNSIIQVADLAGKVIMKKIFNSEEEVIDLSRLEAGVYILLTAHGRDRIVKL